MKLELVSERTGKFLFLLMIVSLICSCLSFVGSVINAWNEDFYVDYVEWLDTTVGIFTLILSLLTVILYLVWIYRVHRDFKHITGDYPITPGGAIRRILIPFYNIVGLWTVYSNMARFMVNFDEKTIKYGRRLMQLIPFYYFGPMISRTLQRMMLRSEQPSISLELWTVGFEVLISLIYICMFVIVTSGVKATKELASIEQASTEKESIPL